MGAVRIVKYIEENYSPSILILTPQSMHFNATAIGVKQRPTITTKSLNTIILKHF